MSDFSKQPRQRQNWSKTHHLPCNTTKAWFQFYTLDSSCNHQPANEGILTKQRHIWAQWIYSFVTICCYGNNNLPQAKPRAERSFPPLFFFLISQCCSSVSISVPYSWGSQLSQRLNVHKHKKGKISSEKLVRAKVMEDFDIRLMVKLKKAIKTT